MNPRPFLIATLAAAAALSVTQRAAATPGYYQLVSAAGSYFTDAGVVINTNTGSAFATSDGSVYRYVTCVASQPGGAPCDTFDPSPPVFWYDWPNAARNAAAQARTTDYGVMQARAWSSGFQPGSTNIPGYRVYGAAANSGFIDEITTSAAAPVVITFVFTLHGSWNDAGTFLFQAGRPGFYDPDVGGATPMVGHTWSNCDNCQFAYDTGSARTLLPGGANGSTDITVLVPFTVNPVPNPLRTRSPVKRSMPPTSRLVRLSS